LVTIRFPRTLNRIFVDDPTNRTWDDIEINCWADKNPFLIASSSNNKSFATFRMHTQHMVIFLLTNNNTIAGAACNLIVSNSSNGIFNTEIPAYEITFDQAVGVFTNDDVQILEANRTFGMIYHQADSNIVVKGYYLGCVIE